jgi:hypothetical protein
MITYTIEENPNMKPLIDRIILKRINAIFLSVNVPKPIAPHNFKYNIQIIRDVYFQFHNNTTLSPVTVNRPWNN